MSTNVHRFVHMLRTHALVVLLALVVGAAYAGPDIYRASSPGYQGINTADATDEDYYLTVINKSYVSTGFVRNPFQYEYRDIGNPFQYFPIEFVLGKLGAALHLSVQTLIIFVEFAFPALLVLLVYAFAFLISGSRLAALALGTTMLLGNEIVHPDGIANLAHTFLFNGTHNEFLGYSRPINPQESSVFFFSTLFALFMLFRNPRSRWALVFSGAGLGVLAYVYPYYWMFAVVVLGVMFLYSLLMREWALARASFGAGIVCLAVMIPFLIVNAPIFIHGGGSALTQAIPSHRIIVEKMILLPLLLYVLIFAGAWWTRGRGTYGAWFEAFAKKYTFILLLLVTGVIVSNHQVLTGRLMFQQHFHFFTNIPMFVLAMTVLAIELFASAPRRWRVAAAGGTFFVLIWYTAGVQVASYRAHTEESRHYQSLAPIFTYLRDQLSERVVLADPFLSSRLTIYTQDYAYGTGGTDTTFKVPQERVAHDYMVLLALHGVTPTTVHAYLYGHRQEVATAVSIATYWRDMCGSYSCLPDSMLNDIGSRYKEFYKQPLLAQLKAYKIDYILWDTKTDPEWHLAGLVQNPPVYESGDFKLYALQ